MTKKKKERRPNKYDKDQHQLICEYLSKELGEEVSDDPDMPGPTAYEGVIQLHQANAKIKFLENELSSFRELHKDCVTKNHVNATENENKELHAQLKQAKGERK